MRFLSTAAVTATVALAACGGSDGDSTEPSADAPPVIQTEPPVPGAAAPAPSGKASGASLGALAGDTRDVVRDAASAAERLAADPSADLDPELDALRERAAGLAEQARSEADPAVDEATGGVTEQVEQGAERARQELSAPERAELRKRLAVANDRVVAATNRLRRVVDPDDAAAVARAELRDAQDELSAVADEARSEVPTDVRREAEKLRERVEALR